jgi:hypothetical protein
MTGITSWANPDKIGAMYPFSSGEFVNGGHEVFLVILLLIFWVGWHAMQIMAENNEYKDRK